MLNNIYRLIHIKQLKGKDRLYKFLKAYGLPYRFIFKTADNVFFNIDPASHVDKHIITSGGYETEVLEALSSEVEEKDVLWDIGANIGFHSLSFKKSHPDCDVFCFEPDYKNFDILVKNKVLNNLNVNLFNFALSSTNSVTELFSMDGNGGMSTLDPWPGFNWNTNTFTIACFNGDYLIENNHLKQPTIIKLDVEGHELQVLLGLRKTLAKGIVKKIIIEQPDDFINTNSEIKTLLQSYGFVFKKLERNEETEHPLSNFEAKIN